MHGHQHQNRKTKNTKRNELINKIQSIYSCTHAYTTLLEYQNTNITYVHSKVLTAENANLTFYYNMIKQKKLKSARCFTKLDSHGHYKLSAAAAAEAAA